MFFVEHVWHLTDNTNIFRAGLEHGKSTSNSNDFPVEALGFAMIDYQVPITCPMNNHDLPSLSIMKQMPEGTSTESVRSMGNIPLIIIMGIIHGTVFFFWWFGNTAYHYYPLLYNLY